LIKPQNKMGGDANMFRTSNVPPQSGGIPDKPGVWPVLDMLSCTPILIVLSFTAFERNYAG
jgi:hypothetical protein